MGLQQVCLTERLPHWEQTRRRHGRLERRRVWMARCPEDLSAYLEREFGWVGVQWVGWIHRFRQRLSGGEAQEQWALWVAGAAFEWTLSAQKAAELLQGHWAIENGVFYVRDVTMDEDRLHGRKIAYGLSGIRNVCLNVLRTLGCAFIPDARRLVAARVDLGLALLL